MNKSSIKKILAIGPQDVYPPIDGGKEGIFGALASLAKKFHVTYTYPLNISKKTDLMGYHSRGIKPCPIEDTSKESLFFIVFTTLKFKYFKFHKYTNENYIHCFSNKINLNDYDAIVCFHMHTWGLAYRLRKRFRSNIPIIVREHNIEYEIVSSYLDILGGVRKLLLTPLLFFAQVEERKMWRLADLVAFLVSRDMSVAKKNCIRGNFILAPEGVPIPHLKNRKFPGKNAPLLILFNPKALQSVANLLFFIEKFWVPAKIEGQLLELNLHITGVTTSELINLLRQKPEYLDRYDIEALGFINDLEVCFDRSLALISPTFNGGGVRKKILEAMANEIPVIATKLDLDSCDFFNENKNILKFTNLANFCEVISRLRCNPDFWLNLSISGRATIEKFSNWDLFGEAIAQELNTLVPQHF